MPTPSYANGGLEYGKGLTDKGRAMLNKNKSSANSKPPSSRSQVSTPPSTRNQATSRPEPNFSPISGGAVYVPPPSSSAPSRQMPSNQKPVTNEGLIPWWADIGSMGMATMVTEALTTLPTRMNNEFTQQKPAITSIQDMQSNMSNQKVSSGIQPADVQAFLDTQAGGKKSSFAEGIDSIKSALPWVLGIVAIPTIGKLFGK